MIIHDLDTGIRAGQSGGVRLSHVVGRVVSFPISVWSVFCHAARSRAQTAAEQCEHALALSLTRSLTKPWPSSLNKRIRGGGIHFIQAAATKCESVGLMNCPCDLRPFGPRVVSLPRRQLWRHQRIHAGCVNPLPPPCFAVNSDPPHPLCRPSARCRLFLFSF